jgi:mannose-6-phosphate isomerase-like protein (cupin superfamily)
VHAEIRRADEASEYATEERCHILEVSNDSGDPDLSIARARVEPGVTTAWHRLTATAERYLVVSGEGRVEVDDLPPTRVGPGDVVRIPAGVAQRITNTGEQDLVFYALCTPRFDPLNYVSLE